MFYWSVGVKNMRLLILFDMLLNPSFKMTTGCANVARSTASTRVQKESIKIRYRLSQQLQKTWCVSEIPYL